MQLGPSEQMLGGVYATLGIFLLLALGNTSANRSLVAFTAWSSLIHAAIMAVQALHNVIPREDLLRAVLPLVIVGVALIVLAPAKAGGGRVLTAGSAGCSVLTSGGDRVEHLSSENRG